MQGRFQVVPGQDVRWTGSHRRLLIYAVVYKDKRKIFLALELSALTALLVWHHFTTYGFSLRARQRANLMVEEAKGDLLC